MNFNKLEDSLKYKFKDHEILQEALTHPSLRQRRRRAYDYERMEFLGDSLLSFVITEMLFKKFPNYSEGKLAKIRSYIVSHEILVQVANKLGLAEHILMAHGEEKSGGRSNSHNLENVMESLLAAIYLDSDIATISNIVAELWQEYLNEEFDFDLLDPKSSLQTIAQHLNLSAPLYEVIQRTGPSHVPSFTIRLQVGQESSTITAHSIKEAEKILAKEMIIYLKKHYYVT